MLGIEQSVVSRIGEWDHSAGLSEDLRRYVRAEFRGDSAVVQGWIASARGDGSLAAVAAAARSAVQAVVRAARALAGAAASPGGA